MLVMQPAAAQDTAPKGATVTVLRATKSCFPANVEISGIVIARKQAPVTVEREGLRVLDTLADPGDAVAAGQPLARLGTPEGGTVTLTAPIAGVVGASNAMIGMLASPRAKPLFMIIGNEDYELAALAPIRDLGKIKPDQPASIKLVGGNDVQGKVREVAATVEPNTQQGQVFLSITAPERLLVNGAGRAIIKTGESCGVSVPLTAILYGNGATVVQVVRRQRVETRRVEVGLMNRGRVEVREGLSEGDVVVARAGALLREGDPVQPVAADSATN